MTTMSNVDRLLAAGIGPHEVVTIAEAAATTYDRNRKTRGSRSGALRDAGCGIYCLLLQDNDYEPTLEAFFEPQFYSAESFANRMGMSKAPVVDGLRRLLEHGFAEKGRRGRNSTVRLLIPDRALTEYADCHLDAFEPGIAGHFEHQHLAERITALYPH